MTTTLFSPWIVGDLRLRHRIVMPPLTRMRATEPDGVPTPLMVDYYAQRASQGGLVIAEATWISWQGKGLPGTPGILTEAQVEAWARVVSAVHEKGGRIFLQLWHMGRSSHSSHHPDAGVPVSASAITPAGSPLGAGFKRIQAYETPRALELAEIDSVIADYRRAAVNALAAGFDGVELHGANGFLVDQFLQDRTNHREDRYGGSIDNRVRFLGEVTDVLTDVCGAHRVGVRLSPFSTYGDIGDSDPIALFSRAIEILSNRGIAYLHLIEPRVEAGMRDDFNTSVPASSAEIFRQQFNGPLIVSGGFTKETAEAAIRSGQADAVAFGRHFIANPDLPLRLSRNLPLNSYDRSTFYGGTAAGYTDYSVAEGDR